MFSISQDAAPPIWVSAVALIDADRRVLVQRRQHGAQHGSLWEFPGGKIEPGESPEDAAVRELAEELSLHITRDNLKPISFACGDAQTSGGRRSLVILLFACEAWQGTPQANVASELAWCDPAELTTWSMPPLDYPLAHALSIKLAASAI